MNKIKFYILITGTAFLFASCSDSFLDVESKTESTTGNFYKTVADANRALIGCYDGWQRTTSGASDMAFYIASVIMADECFGATGKNDGYGYQAVDRFDISISPADKNLFGGVWSRGYAGIYRCNELIMHEDQISWGEDNPLRGTYMGECRALRAILYFDLVRMFGNIPLLTAPTDKNVPQANPDEVYALIVRDLKYAIANIPANAYPKAQAKTNDGRITKYAAAALLARVYLYYTGYYEKTELAEVTKEEVLSGLEDIITSDEFGLIDEFKNLWVPASTQPSPKPTTPSGVYEEDWITTYAGNGNKETILAQKFNYTQDYNGNNDGNTWLVMMGIRGFSFSPYGKGWGGCTVNPKIWSAFATGDTRREASIINHTAEGLTANPDFKTKHIDDQREYTGYTVKKYTPMSYAGGQDGVEGLGDGNFQHSQFQDFVVMRYADVLLMAAELGSPNAETYFKEVRDRAFYGSAAPSVALTQENIMKERMYEFAFEGQRYWDLLRQGVNVAAQEIAETITLKNGGIDAEVTINAQNIISKMGLSQIPTDQITLSSGVLKQNQGW